MKRAWLALGGWLAAGSAHAGDQWTGVYVGGAVGAGKLDAAHSYERNWESHTRGAGTLTDPFYDLYNVPYTHVYDAIANTTAGGSDDGDVGRLLAPFIGGSLRNGRFVYGAEFSFDWTKFDSRSDMAGTYSGAFEQETVVTRDDGVKERYDHYLDDWNEATASEVEVLNLDWKLNLVGRIGYLVTEEMQFYALGGWVRADFDGTTADVVDGTLDGWTVGGGLEHALGQGFFLRAEYRYTEFENLTHATSDSSRTRTESANRTSEHSWSTSSRFESEMDTQEVRLGIAYRLWQP